jgi:hypothetical protein
VALVVPLVMAPMALQASVETWTLQDFQACSAPQGWPVSPCQQITGSFSVQMSGLPSAPLVSNWDITMSGGSVSWGGPVVDLYSFTFTPNNSDLSDTTYYTGQQPWSVSGFLLVADSNLNPSGAPLGSFQVGFGGSGLTQSGGTVNIADVSPISGGTGFPGETGEALLQPPWNGAFGMNLYITSGQVTSAGPATVPEGDPSWPHILVAAATCVGAFFFTSRTRPVTLP